MTDLHVDPLWNVTNENAFFSELIGKVHVEISRALSESERALSDELIGKTHDEISLALSGSESARAAFARIVYRKPRFRHQSCTRLYYFVIDISPVREKGPNSGMRATRQCFHSYRDSTESSNFRQNAYLTLNGNFRDPDSICAYLYWIDRENCAFNGKCITGNGHRTRTGKECIIRTIRCGLQGNTSNRRYVIEFTYMLGDRGILWMGQIIGFAAPGKLP